MSTGRKQALWSGMDYKEKNFRELMREEILGFCFHFPLGWDSLYLQAGPLSPWRDQLLAWLPPWRHQARPLQVPLPYLAGPEGSFLNLPSSLFTQYTSQGISPFLVITMTIW